FSPINMGNSLLFYREIQDGYAHYTTSWNVVLPWNERGAITRRSCCSEFASTDNNRLPKDSAARRVCKKSAASLLEFFFMW
ncbi:hypothetical protein BZG21_42965, partial [Escherichia coli]|nr:hypothetical protein [Escherichia coli]